MYLADYLNHIPIPAAFSLFIQNIVENTNRTNELCLTHKFCNKKALELLKNPFIKKTVSLHTLQENFSAVQNGVVWADLNFKNTCHFFNPATNHGLWFLPSARSIFFSYLNKAEQASKRHNFPRAFFYLGAAAHLLQDMTVPHHVCIHLFHGHKKFERWVRAHLSEFTVLTDNTLPICQNPMELFIENAKFTVAFMPSINGSVSEDIYFHCAQILLSRAQTSSAAFYLWFIKENISIYDATL
ncbi:zinc dependent phospholipase C family protein [Pectinatus frisingensis]|uniref:zinc dependent phospholipase C family protein n=1 Tax=Pectinatus frisingensis TaxID=865 RepID=UPI0018C5967F|nr:zinc dependent phospholipase C family protein [Pectinatus frisingensis]